MRVWTDEQKQKQREAIKRWAPWTKATGPRTEDGKRNSSQNALKHGMRSRYWRDIRSYLYAQRRYRRFIEAYIRSFKKRKAANELLRAFSQKRPFSADICRFMELNTRLDRYFPAIKGLP